MEFIYKGLKAKKERYEITEEEISRRIEQLRQMYPQVTVVTDRAARSGDEVLLDYAGFCDGVQFEGGTAENQTLTLGSNTFIPGFEDQLIGRHPEEAVSVLVTFPEQYPAEHLAGKPAEFKCVIHEIREKKLYELNDEFAAAAGGCSGMDELRGQVKASLVGFYEDKAEKTLQEQLICMAADTLDFTPAPEQLEKALQEQLDALTEQLASNGLSLEMYCTFTKQTEEQLRESMRPEAERTLRVMTAVGKIAGLEGIVPDENDLAEAYSRIAEQNGITLEELQQYNTEEFAGTVTSGILVQKVMEFVRANAEVEE